ncbi:trans-L-3-hydroxyproline dehydratase-like [Saccostrea echinata]|uniref:trans-L-3-hydroxyproline dehydratase-like n=1 Tax=Saccostrea echinata TaxID=191078 RepID=UPI002A802934|nr:trans-L-3-hydroxyproline dehydratase-like [Saccostrea echinata]
MPLTFPVKISTTEMHTAGHVLRIIENGCPEIKGQTLLDKINYMKSELDEYRKLLMWEPRGHYDMFGALLVSPDIETCEFAVIFIHNEGYSTMCGHGLIALGRYLIEKGLVKNVTVPETQINIQCPCGPVTAYVTYDGQNTGAVRFQSVPCFVFKPDLTVEVPGYGKITVDIVYSGAFYAILSAGQYGLDVRNSSVSELRAAAGATTDILRAQMKFVHPDVKGVSFLYGTILTDGKDDYSDEITDTMCVFAEREVDRSPCGSGTSARIALQYFKNKVTINQTRTFRGPSGEVFKAKVVKEVSCGNHQAVVTEVKGQGYFCGNSTFTLEESDAAGKGFLLQ